MTASSPMEFWENGRRLTFRGILIPKLAEAFSLQLITTANTFMLSSYAAETVAAVNISAQILTFMTAVINILSMGAMVLTSIALGADNRKNAAELTGSAFLAISIFSLFLGLLLASFPGLTIGHMNLTGKAYQETVDYFSICAAFYVVTAMQSFFCNMLICNGFSAGSLVVGLISNLLNVIFVSSVLYLDLPLPCSKTQGIAFSAILAQAIAATLAATLFLKKKFPIKPNFHIKNLKRILHIGIPTGMNGISYHLSQIITTGIIASLGILAVNTKVYVTNIVAYICLISLAMGQSAAVLIGRHKGRGDHEKINQLRNRVLSYAMINNTLLAILVFLFRRYLLSIFTTDPNILSVASVILFLDIFVEIFRSINNVNDQALNANGDVKVTLFASTIACWLCNVLPAYLFAIHFGLGLVGCWMAFLLDEIFKATIYLIRWKSGKWKNAPV